MAVPRARCWPRQADSEPQRHLVLRVGHEPGDEGRILRRGPRQRVGGAAPPRRRAGPGGPAPLRLEGVRVCGQEGAGVEDPVEDGLPPASIPEGGREGGWVGGRES